MKNLWRLLSISIFIIISFFCVDLSLALEPPKRITTVETQEDIDPFTVVLYGYSDYYHPYKKFRLKSGTRMLKIPTIKFAPRSIGLGSKVGVLFNLPNYRSTPNFRKVESGHYGAAPFKRITYSKPRLFKKKWYVGSLIIHRKDVGDFLGVSLHDHFYAVPEDVQNTSTIYHKIHSIAQSYTKNSQADWAHLRIVPGGKGSVSWPHGHPNPKDIRVTIKGQNGAVRILPQGSQTAYLFSSLKIGQVASIKMEYVGPFDKSAYQPYKEPPTHKAPPAPKKENTVEMIKGVPEFKGQPDVQPKGIKARTIPEIAGMWKSNINRIYHIGQDGLNFEWGVEGVDERGHGRIDGHNLLATWEGPNGHGGAKGVIVDFKGERRAIRIKWNNGVVFFRK